MLSFCFQAAKKLSTFSGAVTKVKAMNELTKIEASKAGETPEAIAREDTFLANSVGNNPDKSIDRKNSSVASIVANFSDLHKQSARNRADLSMDLLPFIATERPGPNPLDGHNKWAIEEEIFGRTEKMLIADSSPTMKLAWATPRIT